MRKSDKKLDNELRGSLTRLCENELERIAGFQWVTHTVHYPNVSASLRIICVFDNNESLALFVSSKEQSVIESRILKVLADLNVKLKSVPKQLVFDSEENCARFNDGNWAERLS
ncbi:Fis family transcriptional regulator [Motilimonas pumila]|uniref:Fis family transcriptional regulator n=1 Tax=Motilimonas pumila TaxID=2303987 RepID=A0A418YF13_9GAMM|nr:Fis family transcriptional regulator [Motilimonas pumila]RJG47774.1 Fis family transcriptional regulator [Motilimonas pumila]